MPANVVSATFVQKNVLPATLVQTNVVSSTTAQTTVCMPLGANDGRDDLLGDECGFAPKFSPGGQFDVPAVGFSGGRT